MRITRRLLASLCAGVVLAVFTLLLSQPLFLFGVVGIGVWILTHQYQFVRTLQQLEAETTVSQTVSPQRVVTDEHTYVTFTIECPAVHAETIRIQLKPPAALTGFDSELVRDLQSGEENQFQFSASSPVAGRHSFDPPTLHVISEAGLFRESFDVKTDRATIEVEPRRPRDIHVGEGGDRLTIAAGEHEASHGRRSNEPEEIREYQPGDPANRIDWKATARLDSAFVREFEARGDRRTTLLFDHSTSMMTGPEGETQLDYAREVALALVSYAAENEDTIGLTTVDENGLTETIRAGATSEQYRRIRTQLQDLSSTRTEPNPRRDFRRGADTNRNHSDLLDRKDQFSETLKPFFEAQAYVSTFAEMPLFESVREHAALQLRDAWLVIFTSNVRAAEVRETVKLARQEAGHVSIFLTPTVLYEHSEIVDIEAAYSAYTDFEMFRRDLASMEDVSAFEIGPRERLEMILQSSDRNRGTRT